MLVFCAVRSSLAGKLMVNWLGWLRLVARVVWQQHTGPGNNVPSPVESAFAWLQFIYCWAERSSPNMWEEYMNPVLNWIYKNLLFSWKLSQNVSWTITLNIKWLREILPVSHAPWAEFALPFPCQTLEGIKEILSQLRDGCIHLQTRKSAPPIVCFSVWILDSLAERKLTARSQIFLIFGLQT